MVLRFRRIICRVFGHRLIVGTNYWMCSRCNCFKPRKGGIVPTDRVTPGAPPKQPIDEFNVAFQKAKAAGFPEPDTILIPDVDKSKFKSRSLTTAVQDDGGVAVQGEGQTGYVTCPTCGVVPCQCLDTPYK